MKYIKTKENYKKLIKIVIDYDVNVPWLLHCLINHSPLKRYNNNKQQIKRELSEWEYELCEKLLLPLWKEGLENEIH